MLLDYNYSTEKRELQKMVFPLVKARYIVTLAGPNLVTYLNMYPRRVERVEIWENDPRVMVRQLPLLSSIKGRKISYRYGNIINAEVYLGRFYDLDFCGTIAKVRPHIHRFRKCQFALTLSTRHYPLDKTLMEFLETVGEKLIQDIPHPQFNLMKTDKSEYLYSIYKGNCPMLFIFKFDKH